MKLYARLLAVFFVLSLLSLTIFAGEWRKLNSRTLAWLHAVYFLDAKQGWIAGSNGTLLITIDGGTTWKQSPKFTEDNLRDVFFTDDKNGWLLCERDVTKLKNSADARSYLLRTLDGGLTWERSGFFPISKSTSPQFTRLLFSDNHKTAWAIGELGSLYALENNEIWQKQASPTRFLLRGGAIFNESEGVLIGSGSTILHTLDGGKVWRDARIFNGENIKFNSVFFATRTLGWTVGAAGKIFFTTDGGRTWRSQNSGVEADLFDVRFVTPNEGWAVGDDGALLHTTNSGNNWSIENTGSTHRLERIFFNGRDKGFAVGFGGTILIYEKNNSGQPQLKTLNSKRN